MHVAVDRDRCMGSGACVFECPEVFAQDDEGIVVVLSAAPDDSLRASALLAAEACPVACITVD
ncbi:MULTISPECIES: ferredoxin [Rhodococcus erythropolis group]|uniref:ferredoxin n=1 Tax=Rhodococcus erythropolis group TaxID=2840174 RepID=UPI001BE7803D|nr:MULTISPECIES: ferredoxin [Rhodococcus erythropolis group]MBT2266082.1 ferredoxin [Rhodococcus erythropolis]MBT2274259.1 ferredoxin [Rhodococcus qingshengii]